MFIPSSKFSKFFLKIQGQVSRAEIYFAIPAHLLNLLKWKTMKFHISQAWRMQTAIREFNLMRPVLKFPAAMS